MRAALLLLYALSSAGIFLVTAHIPVQTDLDPQKLAGLWHPIAMVSSISEVPEHDKMIAQMDHYVTVSSEGDMKYTVNFKSKGECTQRSKDLIHTIQPGVFKTPNKSKVHFMAVDYDKYAIIYVKMEEYSAMYLSGRRLEVGGGIEEKFKALALDQGFPEGNIKFFERAEQCSP